MATGAQHRGELRLRIEGAFSVTQLCQLADKWNLARDPQWERSTSDAAYGFLRAAERQLGLLELVRRLKIERPLFEWPDIDETALAEWGPPSTAASTIVGDLAADATVVDGPPDGATPAAGTSPSRPAPPAPFPGTVAPRTTEKKGVDPTIVLAIAGVMLLVVLVAFGAGLAWSRRASQQAANNPSTAQPAASGPAYVASRVFDEALTGVADRCDMTISGPATKDILIAAQTDCAGVTSGSKSSSSRHDTNVQPNDATAASRRTPPTDNTPRTTSEPTPPAPREPRAPTRSPCLSRCASEHTSCVSACGPEPGDASQYDSWQSCSSRCLSSESRCRLSCH